MSDNPIEIFIATFDNETEAKQALGDFKGMDREGSIDLIDAAEIDRGADGKVRFPPSLIASAIVGGGAGGIWGKIRDKGFKDEDLKAIGEEMQPGTSAIIAIAEDRMIERLEKGLEGYSKIAKHAVSAEAAVAIVAEQSEESAPVS